MNKNRSELPVNLRTPETYLPGRAASGKEVSELSLTLRLLGLSFNPFYFLEASDDPRISSYLVDHELLTRALDRSPAAIFAPAGGGKTTMRMAATHTHWMNRADARVLPIAYTPAGGPPQSAEEHTAGIVQAGAVALLIGLLHFPRLLMRLGNPEREALVTLLDASLPVSLPFLLERLRSEGDVVHFALRLEKSYRLPQPDQSLSLHEVVEALLSALPPRPPALSYDDSLGLLRTVVLDALGFEQIVVLIDNLDAQAETVNNVAAMTDGIAWPLVQAAEWAEGGLIVKAFLPSELEGGLQLHPELPLESLRPRQVQWTPELLVEVLQRRIFEASGGTFSSLDAVSSSALSGVEQALIAHTLPMPRECILIMHRLLVAYAERTAGAVGQIEPADLVSALAWYDAHRVDPGPFVRL